MDIAFLFGSGASLDAGMPTVGDITREVLRGEGVTLDGDGTFVIAQPGTQPRSRRTVDAVLALIRDLHGEGTRYLGTSPNYEHIATFAGQVEDALSHEYESATVIPFAEQLERRPYVHESGRSVRELSELARRYIADTVHRMLDKRADRLSHLQVVIDACTQHPRAVLATLNHDCVLEEALTDACLPFDDGFEPGPEDVHFWADHFRANRAWLLKLHGSIDWWGFRLLDEQWRGYVAARYDGPDVRHPRRAGIDDIAFEFRPIFLTGTFDKILAYERWIYPDQHIRFHLALRSSPRLVVIGYGFGDKAINTRLIAWLARARGNRLLICHPDPPRLRADARGAIRNHWERWLRDGQLRLIPVPIAELDIEALAAELS